MAKKNATAKAAECGDALVADDGTLTCVRGDGRHLIHRDADGTRFVRAPGGALVLDPKKR